MKRKVVKQGAATLTISLPSKWTKKFELKNGDEINLNEKGDALIVTNSKARALKEPTSGGRSFFFRAYNARIQKHPIAAVTRRPLRQDSCQRSDLHCAPVFLQVTSNANHTTSRFLIVCSLKKNGRIFVHDVGDIDLRQNGIR